MRVLIQRVKEASVSIDGRRTAEIDKGLVLLVGISKEDASKDIEWMAKKIANLRIFEDKDGKMNLNISQLGGEILSVPQFTLYADVQKGNRPGFDYSAPPEIAKRLWADFNSLLKEAEIPLKEGAFGAHMEISLINDGPVTIILDSKI